MLYHNSLNKYSLVRSGIRSSPLAVCTGTKLVFFENWEVYETPQIAP